MPALLLLLLSLRALADDPVPRTYTVSEILEINRAGDWVAVQQGSDEAIRVTPEGDTPLSLGQALGSGDRVVTHQARVELTDAAGEVLVLHEDSDLVLEDYGAWERYGAVLYDVRREFEVRYARNEALVEGTRFLVEGDADGHGSVAVSRGRVRVRSLQGEVLVRRGQLAQLDPGEPPERRRWRPPGQPGLGGAAGDLAKTAGRRIVVGAAATGRYQLGKDTAAGGSGELRATAALRLPVLSVVGSLGLNTAGDQGHFPLSVGVERQIGPLSVGGSGQLSVGLVSNCDAGTLVPQVSGGGSLDLGLHLPVGQHLEVDGLLSGGWLYGPEIKGGVGLSLKL